VVTPSSFGGYREGFGTLRSSGGDLGGGSESLLVHCKLETIKE
jgi:DNA (cytosine-5)-methyltransferase 1